MEQMQSAAADRITSVFQRAVKRRIPLSGSIEMNSRCNLNCVHCYIGSDRSAESRKYEKDTAFWLSVVDQAAEAGCLYLLITGGEPLLRDDFAEVYTRAKERGLFVTVFTNGTRITESILDLFTELPPRLVEISLYGATRETYERVTGVPGSYEACLKGVDELLARGIRVGLKTMIMKETQHEVDLMRRMAEERGVSFRVDPALVPCRDGGTEPLEHRVSPGEAVALELGEMKARQELADYYEKRRALPAVDSLYSCLAGLTTFHVDPKGTLRPCMMVTSHGLDLARGTFKEGWEAALLPFRQLVIPPGYECNSCEQRVICGLCPAEFTLEKGSPYQKADYFCSLGAERHNILKSLIEKGSLEA